MSAATVDSTYVYVHIEQWTWKRKTLNVVEWKRETINWKQKKRKKTKNPIVGCRNLCSVERENWKKKKTFFTFSIFTLEGTGECKHKHENKMKPTERPPQLLVPQHTSTYLNHLLSARTHSFDERIAHTTYWNKQNYLLRRRRKNSKKKNNKYNTKNEI